MIFTQKSYFGKTSLTLNLSSANMSGIAGGFVTVANPFIKSFFATAVPATTVPFYDTVNISTNPFQGKSLLYHFRPYAQSSPVDDLQPLANIADFEKFLSTLIVANQRTGQAHYIGQNTQGISEMILAGTGQTFLPVPCFIMGCVPFDSMFGDNIDVALICTDGKQDGALVSYGIGDIALVQDLLPAFNMTSIGGKMYTS